MKKTEAALDDSAEERDKENYIVKSIFCFIIMESSHHTSCEE